MTAMPAASISGAGHVLLAFGGLVTIVEILLGDAVGSLVVSSSTAASSVCCASSLVSISMVPPRPIDFARTEMPAPSS